MSRLASRSRRGHPRFLGLTRCRATSFLFSRCVTSQYVFALLFQKRNCYSFLRTPRFYDTIRLVYINSAIVACNNVILNLLGKALESGKGQNSIRRIYLSFPRTLYILLIFHFYWKSGDVYVFLYLPTIYLYVITITRFQIK